MYLLQVQMIFSKISYTCLKILSENDLNRNLENSYGYQCRIDTTVFFIFKLDGAFLFRCKHTEEWTSKYAI